MNYSIEEIDAAIQRAGYMANVRDAIMVEIQRPMWVPRVGEVYAHQHINDEETDSWRYAFYYPGWVFDPEQKRRPLVLSEMPMAVADLRAVVDGIANGDVRAKFAASAAQRSLNVFDDAVKRKVTA